MFFYLALFIFGMFVNPGLTLIITGVVFVVFILSALFPSAMFIALAIKESMDQKEDRANEPAPRTLREQAFKRESTLKG